MKSFFFVGVVCALFCLAAIATVDARNMFKPRLR